MTFTVGDTAPPLLGACQHLDSGDTGCVPNVGSAAPANLAGAAIELHIARGRMPVLTKVPTVVSAMHGTWSCDWAVGDLAIDGLYTVEAQVTYGGGSVQTFGPASFRVKRQIA